MINKFEYDEKIDFLIHAAGIASPHYYQAYPLEALDVAITGTRLMLDLVNKIMLNLHSFLHLKFMEIQI